MHGMCVCMFVCAHVCACVCDVCVCAHMCVMCACGLDGALVERICTLIFCVCTRVCAVSLGCVLCVSGVGTGPHVVGVPNSKPKKPQGPRPSQDPSAGQRSCCLLSLAGSFGAPAGRCRGVGGEGTLVPISCPARQLNRENGDSAMYQ